MSNAIYNVPVAGNEPVLNYAPGSPEKALLKKSIAGFYSEKVDIPMHIGGKEIRSGNKKEIHPPHNIKHLCGHYHAGDANHVKAAISAALKAKKEWANTSWENRAAIFLKAAELISGPYRYKINAATMIGQSKNVMQAELDSACELADFLRFNVQYMREIYAQQPQSSKGVWNRVEQRPLEGFVFALTPFNFTAIAGNLPSSVAMMGNTVVWKPANVQIYSANVIMEIFFKAGLPDGVINLIYVSGPVAGEIIFSHPEFAGIHYTGSTEVFRGIWKSIGEHIATYKSYPRIVGETGGKDFIMAHPSADEKTLITALVRGAFEYQGQKCSAASRAYIPKSVWKNIQQDFLNEIASIKMGPTEDFNNFFNAVIDEGAYNKIASYIDTAKKNKKEVEIIAGGTYSKEDGYFIKPTVLLARNPLYRTMCEEIFGPVLTLYIYDDNQYKETLKVVDSTGNYALTGAIISQDRYSIDLATKMLVNAAGNFYINDKCTGAVVGQQPFGGGRASGTNDKAGSMINLLRWVSPRTIKETFTPAASYRYPFMEK